MSMLHCCDNGIDCDTASIDTASINPGAIDTTINDTAADVQAGRQVPSNALRHYNNSYYELCLLNN
jgi:hypothetical protein